MVEWTFECAKKSEKVDKWILSTDDKKIIEISKNYQVKVPFVRPDELATDTATSFDVVKHCLEWLQINENSHPDWLILLEPTSPGRQFFHIDEVVEIIEKNSHNIDSICCVSKLMGGHSASKALKIDESNLLKPYFGNGSFSDIAIPNQLVTPSYFINSAIYAFNAKRILSSTTTDLWGNNVYAYEIDSQYACDIDTMQDWIVAESKMKYIMKRN